jgi:hypothetical protein
MWTPFTDRTDVGTAVADPCVTVAVTDAEPVRTAFSAGELNVTPGKVSELLTVTDRVAVPEPSVEVAVIDMTTTPLVNVEVSRVHDGVRDAWSGVMWTPPTVSTEVGTVAADPWVTVAVTGVDPEIVADAAGAVNVTVGLTEAVATVKVRPWV